MTSLGYSSNGGVLMAQAFFIPKHSFEGLTDLVQMGPEKLERLVHAVADREPTVDFKGLAKSLSSVVECDEEVMSRAISMVLLPLAELRSSYRMSTEEFLILLDEVIATQNHTWFEEHESDWRRVAPMVGRLIVVNGFFWLLHKVARLLVNRPAVVRELKILTELRPVYDEEVTTTRAMLLTSTLAVEYQDGAEVKRLHLAFDQEDLQALQGQIHRLEKKIALLQAQAGRGVVLLVAGSVQG